MKGTRTTGLPPINEKIKLDDFREHIEELFQLFYPDELFNGNQIHFQNGIFRGATVKIQLSCISIIINHEFLKGKPALAREQKMEFEALNVFFHYTASNKTVYLYPRDRDNFPANVFGAEMKANYFFLVAQAALHRMVRGDFPHSKVKQ